MEIKITCRACDRTFPLSLAVDPDGRAGHCSFCGEALAPAYTSTFTEAAQRLLNVGPEFVRQLTGFAEIAGAYAIDEESIAGAVAEAIAVQNRAVSEPHRPAWPPAPAESLG